MSDQDPHRTEETETLREGRRYWRSVERLLDSPGVDPSLRRTLAGARGAEGEPPDGKRTESKEGDPARAGRGRPLPRAPQSEALWSEGGERTEVRGGDPAEFPAGADLPPDGFSRRTMLGLMGASFGLAGLTACRRPVEHIVPYVEPPEERLPGVPERYATTLPLGTSAYGVVVESHDGRPTKIEGNPRHPSSLGAASSWMQASVLELYDPDRGRKVLRRPAGEAAEGAEGAEEGEEPRQRDDFEESTWDDFATFWSEVASPERAPDGRGIAVLSEGFASPTTARLVRRFRERYPEARFAVWEPAGEGNAFAGIEQATGRAQRPVLHLEEADVVLALDADLLLTEGEALANARGFARGRKPERDRGMNRLYAVEPTLTVTGANADHRLRVPASQVRDFADELARRLGAIPPDGSRTTRSKVPEAARRKVGLLARELGHAGRRALVVAGRRQPPEVHALAHALNQALGAVGTTVTLEEVADTGWGRPGDVAALAGDLRAGEVSTLVILGGNPAYDAPGSLRFAEALDRAEHVVHLAPRPDETSEHAAWYLPQSHFLEAWGDARAADGTASVVQPLIAPLFDTRSTAEVLALLTGEGAGEGAGEEGSEGPATGYELVRRTWGVASPAAIGPGSAWRRILHDGVAPPEAAPAGSVVETGFDGSGADAPAAEGDDSAEDGLELVFLVSPSVFDGRFANNAWLQEQPDPLTRISWDNALLVSPATAEEHDLADGDIVRLEIRGEDGERSVEAPVWRAPGLADGTVALELGYGRTKAGRVGSGVGADANPLREARNGWWVRGVTLAPTGRRHELAQTQEHWSMEERDLVREAPLEEYREHPDFASHVHGPPLESLWEEPSWEEGHQWGMTVDLSSCIG
ncbi:MAG: hypothetical protein ACLF0P_08435, partial [Thermoanaerobaculia bacterium]